MNWPPFTEAEKTRMLTLIQEGLDELKRIDADLRVIQNEIDNPKTAGGIPVVGRREIIKAAADAADIEGAKAAVTESKKMLDSVWLKIHENAEMSDNEVGDMLAALDRITDMGREINRSSEMYNGIIRRAVETN